VQASVITVRIAFFAIISPDTQITRAHDGI
jgi:hypothetical protein